MKRLTDLGEVKGKTVKSIEITKHGIDVGTERLKIIFTDNTYIEIASEGLDDCSTKLWVLQGTSDGH